MDDRSRFPRFGTTDEFFPAHPDALRVVVPGQPHPVRFRFLADDLGQGHTQITLCIQIDDETTIDDIKTAWSDVMRWRDLIRQDPEHYPWMGTDGAYFNLWRDHEEGWSYKRLANRTNQRIAECLASGDPIDHEHADDILRLCRPSLSPKRRARILSDALGEIADGQEPFGDEEPVTSSDVRQRVRDFKKKWRKRFLREEYA